MRSSTSNSDADRSKWLKAWLLAACLVVLIIAAWEGTLRREGHEPAYSDNRPLWMSARHKLTRPDESVVAILGASRIQRAIDIDLLSDRINRPVVQLAIEASSGLPVLENLAADPRFRGTVIFSITPAFSFNQRASKLDVGFQGRWISAYMRQSRSRRLEQELRLSVRGLFAFRSAGAALSQIVTGIIDTGQFPGPGFKTIHRNRFVSIDQSKLPVEVSQEGIVALYRENSIAYDSESYADVLQYFSTLADLLKAKGCRIFVVRLPSEGAVLDYELDEYPQVTFWEQLQHQVDANFIHFQDYPELEGYLSPDGSHIAAEKASDFTKQFAAILSANGL